MKNKFFLFLVSVLFIFGGQVKAQVPTSSLDVSPLLIGEKVPDGTLTNRTGNEVSFYSLIAQKPTVVIFYRGDWCPNCIKHFTTEIVPNVSEIQKMGYNLIAISPDAPDKLFSTAGKTKLEPDMLFSDGTGALAKSMGIGFKESMDRLQALLLESSGGKNVDRILPVPAVFVIGTDQKIQFEYINPNGPQSDLRMKWKLLQPVLQALK